jgi:phosphonate metabolism protein PhnN/1,5-bisphosphokinase (PRPP-forming)
MTSSPLQTEFKGRLVLVVGPSGAGKDTLLDLARTAHKDNPDLVFARRVITREPMGEDHDTLDEAAFMQAQKDGAFLLAWAAHGLHYGIPAALTNELQVGRTVVANVSRSVIPEAENLDAHVTVLNVTAGPDVLARRIAARGRESLADIEQRVRREQPIVTTRAQLINVQNDGALDDAARLFMAALGSRFQR